MKLNEQLDLQSDIEVPWGVWRMFACENGRSISVNGNHASFGGDYGSKEELRAAIAWYVDQLGGKVKWE
jgi:hypothetical protein